MSDDVMKTEEKIRTGCPHCGQRMRIKSKYLNKTIPCPTCKTPFLVKLIEEAGDATGEQSAVDSGNVATAANELEAGRPNLLPPTKSEADALMKVLHDSESATRGGAEESDAGAGINGGGDAFEQDHKDEAPADSGAESGGDESLGELGNLSESGTDGAQEQEVSASASFKEEPAAESAAHEAEDSAAEERRTSPPDMSRPPAYKKPQREVAMASPRDRGDHGDHHDGDHQAPATSRPARRPVMTMTSRVDPSKHFKAYISSSEAAIAEYDFGISGILVPERSRVLVTDKSVLVLRKRSYLFGLLPGADSWYMQYPIDAKELAQARVYVPSIGRAFGVFLLALLLGGAVFAVMFLNHHEDPAMQEKVAFLGHFDLFSWLLNLRFDLNDMDTYWWTAAPAIAVLLYYWWTFKAWFETGAFRLPIGRGKARQMAVRSCLHTIGEIRSGHLPNDV